MLKKASSNKKRWITIPIVGVLTTTIIAGVLYNTSETASARISLPGIEKIAQSNSKAEPFTILEIVPSYDQAKIGYLVKGEEPAYYDNNGVLALADMGSPEERADRYHPYFTADTTDSLYDADADPVNNNFTALNKLNGKAFTWEKFVETSTNPANSFKTYGQFVDKSDVGSTFDYTDARLLEDAFKPVVIESAESDEVGNEAYSLKTILNTLNTKTTGEVFDNEIVYTFTEGNNGVFDGYIPSFESAKRVTDIENGVFYPFTSYNEGGLDYFDWNYYVADLIEFSKDEDPDDSTKNIYSLNTETNEFKPVYIDVDGADADEYYDWEFLGLIYSDGSDWKYRDINGIDVKLDDAGLETIYEEYFSDEEGSEGIYYNYPDAEFCSMKEYISYEAPGEKDFYYVSGISKTIGGVSEPEKHSEKFGFVNPETEKYRVRIVAGQDPTQYGLDVDDKLDKGYHKYFFRLNTADAIFKYVGDSTKNGTHVFVSDFSKDENETIKYNGGFSNDELFKKYALDRDAGIQCDETVIDVVTKLYGDVSTDDIDNADLIYINGGIVTSSSLAAIVGSDMSDEVVAAILESIIENKAIVVEAEALHDISDSFPNIQRLAVSLAQDSLADANINTLADITKWTAANLTELSNKRNTKGDYTKRTVFVTPSDDTTYVDVICDKDSKGNLEFTKTISNDTRLAGYKDVTTDISNEIFYIEVAYGKNSKKANEFNDKVSYGTIIRHILNFGNRRVTTKNSYNILDIEPYYSDVFEKKPSLFGTTFLNDTYGNQYTVSTASLNDGKTRWAQRDIFNKQWFINNICEKSNAPDITVKGMGTKEFVGNITDLNTTYDMIYIGLDTLYMNTTSGYDDKNKRTVKSRNTIYNDSNMNGLVYSHIGDIMSYGVGRANKNDSGIDTGSSYRTGGNDITFEKLRDLERYVEAGYAVLLSNDFFTYYDSKNGERGGAVSGINEKMVDKNSYMHDFIKLCLYGSKYIDKDGNVQTVDIDKAIREHDYSHGYMGKNVNIVKDFDATNTYYFNVNGGNWEPNVGNLSFGTSFADNKENFVNYLNIQKLDIYSYHTPQPYYDEVLDPVTNTTTMKEGNYLQSKNGGYYLDYTVELINKAAVGSPSYDCKLYIDVNADGRYSELEAQDLNDIKTSDGSIPATKVDGKFMLSTGTKYDISLKVPEDFKGFLSWKLEFTENDRKSSTGVDLVKKSITGYSAVPSRKARTTIKVLQLTSITNSYGQLQNHLNLDSQSMHDLYDKVQDFKIDVKVESVGDFVQTVKNEDKLQHLMDYDMVVMGFSDCYSLPNSGVDNRDTYEAVYAIREYILSGRSMLFTHDLNSPYYFDKGSVWGCFLNEFIRELQGMDRYGMTQEHIALLESKVGKKCTPYASRYDDDNYNDIWGRKSTKVTNDKFNLTKGTLDKLGILYGQFGKYRNGTELGDVSNTTLRRLQQDNDRTWDYNFASKKVSMVNEGQITDYPFHIGESLDIAATHPQYFQLNLDTDSMDDNFMDDAVVWYCIDGVNNGSTSAYYSMDYNDARNNYYIYNKGNITYTGSGHATIGEDQIGERKLFVNTMVAAYSAGQHPPVITYKQSSWNQSADISAIYEPYDVNLEHAGDDETEGGALGNTITVNFKAVNNNLLNNKEKVEDVATGEASYKFKKINVVYYVADPNGAYNINGEKVTKINPNDIELYMVADSTGNVINSETPLDNVNSLDNGAIYTAKIKNSYFLHTTTNAETGDLVLNSHSSVLYIRACMDAIDESKTDVPVLPGTESFNALEVNYTELYELR